MSRWKLWTLALSALALAGLVLAVVEGRPGERNRAAAALPGYGTYREHCQRCHGAWGDGRKPSRLAKRLVDLTAPAFRDTMALEDVRHVIRNGQGRMKGLDEKLLPAEVDSAARFVLTMPGRP